MRDTEAVTVTGLRHRLSVLERIELDASIERMVATVLKSARPTFGPRCTLEYMLNLRVSGQASMVEARICVSVEPKGELFSNPLGESTPDGLGPATPDRAGED